VANSTQAFGLRSTRVASLAFAVVCILGAACSSRAEDANVLRVCADPNNLPFSNEAKAGFENKLADLVADELHQSVTYTWHAQRRGFVRETLKANACDVVMGVPKQYDLVETTIPYYRSGYVFVTRTDRHLDIRSIKDPRLRTLRIAVQLIGDDGANTPPAHALAAQGITDNVRGFPVYGDYHKPNPPSNILTAVEEGDVDIAAVWGPLAGYFAKQSGGVLTINPMIDTESFAPLIFQFDMAMGVRKGDDALRATLDRIITQRGQQIDSLLESFGIPLVQVSDRPLTLKRNQEN
jgi:mxaJ protein